MNGVFKGYQISKMLKAASVMRDKEDLKGVTIKGILASPVVV